MKCVIPTRVGGTRWVPHTMKSINIFQRSYNAVMTHLKNAFHKNPKAEGLAKLAGDAGVVGYLLMLKDVLTPVSKLPMYLQREDTTLGDAMCMVDSTLQLLSTESIIVWKDRHFSTGRSLQSPYHRGKG